MADSSLNIKLPQELIENTIRVEMVKQLGNHQELMEGIVKAALSAKENNYSHEPTIFLKKVQEMIRTEAQNAFRDWVEENRPAIRQALLEALNRDRKQRIAEIVDTIVNSLGRHQIHVESVLNIKRVDERDWS